MDLFGNIHLIHVEDPLQFCMELVCPNDSGASPSPTLKEPANTILGSHETHQFFLLVGVQSCHLATQVPYYSIASFEQKHRDEEAECKLRRLDLVG